MDWILQKVRNFRMWWKGLSCFGQILPVVLVVILSVALVFYLFFEVKEDSIIQKIASGEVRNLGLLLAASIGWFFLYWRAKTTDRNAEAAEQSAETAYKVLTTEQFTRAIEQLAHERSSVRFGGIHALAEIFGYHKKERSGIIQLLTAFVHDFAPGGSGTRTLKDRGKYLDIETAVQALSILRERYSEGKEKSILGLQFTNLSGLRFLGTNMSYFDLFGVNFSNSYFYGVDFTGAKLGGVNFSGVHLVGSRGLTQEQLKQAFYWKDNPPKEFPPELKITEKDLPRRTIGHS